MNKRRFPTFLSVLLMAALCASCARQGLSTLPEPSPAPTPRAWPVTGWERSAPEAQGMDSARLAEMMTHIQQKEINMHSILVFRNGYQVLEAYFNPYTAETPHQIASITKSVMGALVGIAIEQGKIQSVREPVVRFFPEREFANLDARKKAMTLEHLLMLAPGLDCSDVQGTEGQMMQSADWVQFVLDLPMKAEPGAQWTYCSSAVHLVSAILQKTTGMDARSYANQFLFAPIGIQPVPPERWYSDPQGISGGGNGLMLTPNETARFAYLYLNQGRWNGKQVVPARWVAASLAPRISVGTMKEYGNMPRSYGYLWSLYPDRKLFSALGRNGQHIHVFPEENLLVIFTSATPVASDERQFDLLLNYLLPAVRSKTALPENPSEAARLAELVEQAAWPRQAVSALTESGKRLNGRTARFGENAFGWQTLALNFAEGENTAEAVINGENRVRVGLDNIYRVQNMGGGQNVGFKAWWDDEDRLIVRQVMIGGWQELEIRFRLDGDRLIIDQRDVVDGGSLIHLEGMLE